MEPPRKHKSSDVPVKEEVELEDGNDLLAKRRRTEFSGSIVQPKQEIGVFDMENKVAVQNSGQANGCSNELASLRLLKICNAIGWKEPSFDFEEQGPPHNRKFTCKVTLHMEGLADTTLESFSDPKPKKKAARENAAQGALWCLHSAGYVK